ncbi:thioredoxin-disulfide reductase [Candidatus Bathyarchaeota archaeon]|nr:thioredoxin-disulfide reductase [Candidatus Bathyarchaeota archaeon]NIR13199.1 thioredoxin-disulfide reductase [Desulfobacterales bacterium]NIU81253.1 thioredoxin-disulfide reductase [Candidatus Bathyarchaeota archaeon]NIV67517.1 thioredoxin-disulfide reductase [Candidatus Bathyarchaeota archaeon]NIW16347.1 thioredoxin-disulfide reductase [Candidatus Bathyarchaeota archaeon]
MENWDLIIIGGGPAGLTAGIYGARSGLRTLLLEAEIPGGAAADTPLVENYPGFPEGISGQDLTERMAEQCRRTGAEIKDLEKVTALDSGDERYIVKTNKARYITSAVIVTSGCHYRTLGVPGESELRGRGVSYCALCDGAFFKGRKVLVIGGGNSAAVSAIYLSNLASDVKLVHRRNQLRADEALQEDLNAKGVEILWNRELKEIRGEEKVEKAVLLNNKTGKNQEIDVDGIFVQVGESPNSQFAEESGIDVDERGYIIVDDRQRTNVEGVYAAGDVTNCPVKQIGTAVGQAIIAANEAFGYVKQPYYYRR